MSECVSAYMCKLMCVCACVCVHVCVYLLRATRSVLGLVAAELHAESMDGQFEVLHLLLQDTWRPDRGETSFIHSSHI